MSAWLRLPGMKVAMFVAALMATLPAACGALPGATASAVWTVAPGQDLDSRTTKIEVLVSRVGCNSGVTGQVVEPEIQLDDDRVIVAFSVQPGEPAAADCQGNPEVPYVLTLPVPLGSRQLVDGQCLNDEDTARTVHCERGGVRYDP